MTQTIFLSMVTGEFGTGKVAEMALSLATTEADRAKARAVTAQIEGGK